MDHRLIYPTPDVPLAELAQIAVEECGGAEVTLHSGSGERAVRVPAACADRVEARAGLTSETAPEPDVDSTPDSGAPKHPARRASKTTRRTTARRKEG